MAQAKYARVLLKISGEGLCATGKTGIDGASLKRLAEEIKLVVDLAPHVIHGDEREWTELRAVLCSS